MARSLLLLSSIALMAMIARGDTSGDSDSMWSESSGSNAAPTPTPGFPTVNGCMVKTTNNDNTPITVDLADIAQADDVQVSSGDYSFTFSPCQQRSLTECAGKAVEGNLVIKNKNACVDATDVYNVAAQGAIKYDAAKTQWMIQLQNGNNGAFQVTVKCDATATTTTVTSFDEQTKTLVLADYRVCAQEDTALAPVTVTGCETPFKYFGNDLTANLNGFQAWFTSQAGANLPDVRVQSCTASAFADSTTGPKGCTGNGYFAFTNAADQCVVLQERTVLFYPGNQTFSSKYFNNAATGRGFAAQNLGAEEDAKTVQVSCGPDNAYVADESNANFYSFTSPTVCGTPAPPAVTPAPEEKKGLSAGAVAGIVIGVIAVIVLIAVAFVCFRSKSRSAEDGEYNRV